MGWFRSASHGLRNVSPRGGERFRPTLEALEQRLAPALVEWRGPGTNWCESANWVGGSLPVANDDAVIGDAFSSRNISVPCSVTIQTLRTAAQIQVQSGTFTLDRDAAGSEFKNTFRVNEGATLVFIGSQVTGNGGQLVNAGVTEVKCRQFCPFVVDLGIPVVNQGEFRVFPGDGFSGNAHKASRGFLNEPGAILDLQEQGALDFTTLDNRGDIFTRFGSMLGQSVGLRGTLTNYEEAGQITILGTTHLRLRALANSGTVLVQSGNLVFSSFGVGLWDIGVENRSSGRICAEGGNVSFERNGFTGESIPLTNFGTPKTNLSREIVYDGNRLTNFSGRTLTGGTYALAGTFRFSNADIMTNAANVILDGPGAHILDHTGRPGLSNFTTNTGGGTFVIRNGADFSTTAFTNAGAVGVEGDTRFFVSGTYTQTANGSTYLAGSSFIAASILIGEQSYLGGWGAIEGNVENRGWLDVGGSDAAGKLTILGNFTQTASGALIVEFGGGTSGVDADFLDINGMATLDGGLVIRMLNGYLPAPDDSLIPLCAEGGITDGTDFAWFDGLQLSDELALYPFHDGTCYYLWAYAS